MSDRKTNLKEREKNLFQKGDNELKKTKEPSKKDDQAGNPSYQGKEIDNAPSEK